MLKKVQERIVTVQTVPGIRQTLIDTSGARIANQIPFSNTLVARRLLRILRAILVEHHPIDDCDREGRNVIIIYELDVDMPTNIAKRNNNSELFEHVQISFILKIRKSEFFPQIS